MADHDHNHRHTEQRQEAGHDHDHGHDHARDHVHTHQHGGGGHHHAPVDFGRAFAIGVGLNTAYIVAEAFWGISAHSVALLADAGHNLGDVAGLLGAWLAAWLSKRRPSGQFTYGLRRSSILAALANAIILLLVTGGIAWEAIQRLITPDPAGGLVIMVVAVAGIFVNGITAWLFMSGRKGDLNIKAAFMHMAADALLTFGVAVAGGIIMLTGWLWLDPAVSLVVSLVIIVGTWSLLRDSVNLSLDAVPRGIDQDDVSRYLGALPGVSEVHDLHIWAMSTTETALTAHLVREDAGADSGLLCQIALEVRERFGIGHATVQFENAETADRCALRSDHVV
ncbi:MAG TPA: cation diffusion facilitator family transporter [Rhodopila sp.]|nr:cation diffusion facilitator family transporter [Rhodopila sp.]